MGKEAAKRKRVLVVGAGAAGMACVDLLADHPDRFDVTLIEAQGYCGGQAFSIDIDEKKYGVPWMNQGVQGGSYIYHHTFSRFHKYGYEEKPVELQVSFGKGDKFWTNLFPTELLEKHGKEIKRFARAMKIMKYTEFFWALIPIKVSLRMFGFSSEFMNFMIYPALALFLGTGNATPDLPSVMMERLYNSPTYGMWYKPDPQSLSSNLPPMVVFPEETKFYTTWKEDMIKRGVKVRLNTEVDAILERSSKRVRVLTRPRREQPDHHNPNDADQDLPQTEEEYDEIVLACLADTSKRLLGKTARWIDRAVLGSAKWSDDITVTHTDTEYMKKHYTVDFDEERARPIINGRDDTARVERGKKDFNPMYLIKQTPSEPRKLEMCFDCSNFQYQLKDQNLPFDKHIFQTIFLNKDQDGDKWDINEIDKDKIIRQDWWHQLCHSWTHYLFVVPWMWLLNGKKRTRYAAAWTLVNAHELAIISGMAAAYSLGAAYPVELEEDKFAMLCFKSYLLLSHGTIYRKGKNRAPGVKANEAATTVSQYMNPSGPGRDYSALHHSAESSRTSSK